MGNPREPLTFNTTYHIYNHAVGNELFFREEKNYYFFMQKFYRWVLPVSDVISYCLIPNHFHFCLRIKSQAELSIIFKDKLTKKMKNKAAGEFESDLLERIVIEQFSNFFNSYAQSYNKLYHRMGSLFKESFQRKVIHSDDYLKILICYIHNNPVKHRLVRHPSHWKFSGFNDLFLEMPTMIQKKEVLQLFDTIENMLGMHQLYMVPEWLSHSFGVRE